ncbi:peptidase C1, partial [bacterium]|nr:peptidase C1 [bacterium]
MKKAFTFMSVFFLFIIFNFFFLSCTQEAPEKAEVQKQVIQLEKEEIQKSSQAVYKTREFRGKERTYLSTDFSEVEKPSSLDKFTQHYHHSPVRQFWTGTCWCFATTSFLESELKRLGKGEI